MFDLGTGSSLNSRGGSGYHFVDLIIIMDQQEILYPRGSKR